MHTDLHASLHRWTSSVQTRTPRELLAAARAPTVIDYLSLDVEGAEMEILRAFPFDEYRVLFATIETNNDAAKEDEMRTFMESVGHVFLGHTGNDDYYASAPINPGVAFNPKLEYTNWRRQHDGARLANAARAKVEASTFPR